MVLLTGGVPGKSLCMRCCRRPYPRHLFASICVTRQRVSEYVLINHVRVCFTAWYLYVRTRHYSCSTAVRKVRLEALLCSKEHPWSTGT